MLEPDTTKMQRRETTKGSNASKPQDKPKGAPVVPPNAESPAPAPEGKRCKTCGCTDGVALKLRQPGGGVLVVDPCAQCSPKFRRAPIRAIRPGSAFGS